MGKNTFQCSVSYEWYKINFDIAPLQRFDFVLCCWLMHAAFQWVVFMVFTVISVLWWYSLLVGP